LKYSHANSANSANSADTEWLGIVAWWKYSHANSANSADTGWLTIIEYIVWNVFGIGLGILNFSAIFAFRKDIGCE
jgi:hypothetical protein